MFSNESNRNRRFQIVLVYLLLCLNSATLAQEYGFDTWTTANGLPQNTVTGVVQTPDGYLWLSTFDGLARFDGVRFTIFDKGNTKGIVDNRFAWLFVDREGTLFATTDNKVITVYRNGTFTSYSQFADSGETIPYTNLKGDKDGNAIIETDKAEYYLQGDQFVLIPDQKVSGSKLTYFGKSGAKWVFEPNQISRIKEGQITTYQIKVTPLEMILSLGFRPYEDNQGELWISRLEPRQLVRLKDGVVSILLKARLITLMVYLMETRKSAFIVIYRIIQESLNNVIKHANATKVAVKIKRTENQVVIMIKDDGKGFDVENVSSGHGLAGLKERSQLLNGELLIDSKIDEGTRILVTIGARTARPPVIK